MDRMKCCRVQFKTVYLCYSIGVLFDVADKFGSVQTALELLQGDGKDSFQAVRWFAARLSQEGAICRGEMGYPKPEILTEEDITSRMPPVEYAALREAVVEAVGLGYKREMPEKGERDLGLEELNEKKIRAGV